MSLSVGSPDMDESLRRASQEGDIVEIYASIQRDGDVLRFARKLNPEDFTPIHLAEENGHEELALHLMENGATSNSPLHYAITREQNLGLLARFLEACPECFRDMTTTKQTALHIATRNNRLEALQLLRRILRKSDYCQDVMNQKDRNGDTALHIAAHNNQPQADKFATNQAGSTALTVAHERNKTEIAVDRLSSPFRVCLWATLQKGMLA
ncbi:Ankyrin repeat-containing protein, putative [Theobroma cacao]|uniref:Ankyrin repeat-containing protein, putative n=1 Tax=Theobroma cacao TaxID=3641 RepID=A0A061FLY9_THECC|nr:Ankyrin repeat-containing protein, putative [Theobroma cacao]